MAYPAFVDLSRHGPGWQAPSLRLAFSYLPERDVEQVVGSPAGQVGTAELSRFAGELSGCPLQIRFRPTLVLRPCLGVQAGALLATVGGVDEPADQVVPWLAGTMPLRLQYSPLDWALIELSAELGVPLVRHRFYFEPDLTVLQVSPIFAALGWQLPLTTGVPRACRFS
ncbi:MAG: hypothetical protein HY744_27355 [Deltaproteobacteria bacterium]|nr:hypothetical protein [Deltaproteobacteria bacterium]